MSQMRFAWDERRDAANQRKYGVSSAEAATVFHDERALLVDDQDHSDAEDRFVVLGLSSALRMLVVCHCYRESDTVIRIISARRAGGSEADQYRRRWRT